MSGTSLLSFHPQDPSRKNIEMIHSRNPSRADHRLSKRSPRRLSTPAGLFLLMLFAAINPMKAQSLDDLYARARDNNPMLRAQEQVILAEDTKARQTGNLPDPMLTFQAFVLPVETRLGPQRAGVSVMQVLPWFGLLESQKEAAGYSTQTQQIKKNSLSWQLYQDLGRAYYDLLELELERRNKEAQLIRLQSFQRVAEIKIANGKARLSDVLKLELELNALREQLATLLDRRAPLELAIARLVGEPVKNVAPPDSLSGASWPFSADSTWQMIRSQHPQFEELEIREALLGKQSEIAGLMAKPSFTAGLGYVNVGPRSDATPEQNGRDIVQVQAGIRIPLHGDQYRAAQEESRFRQSVVQAEREGLEWRLQQELAVLMQQHQEANRKALLYESQIRLMNKAIDLQLQEYAVEATGFEELLRSERQLLDYQLARDRSLLLQHRTVISLSALTGQFSMSR